ncbi:hypothetical protein Gotur_007065 [Gossypium turneri]
MIMNLRNKSVQIEGNLQIVTRIGNPYGHPNILAKFIAGQLKNRVSFRKAVKKAIELTEQADTKGIQIQIAGHIDKKEITRVEWIREGRVPLQTIGAKIEYCSYRVRTIYGILPGVGILLWRKYCTGGSATITVTGGLATYTITGSFAAILLLAALLRYCCWHFCCDAIDGFVPIILPLLMAVYRSYYHY